MSIASNKINQSGSSLNQTHSSKSAKRSVGHLTNYGSSKAAKILSQGEIVKGEVTDLRNNEVTITLEDNTYITGRLENGSRLSIGETAAFKVVELGNGRITLKTLPRNEILLENNTIQKALEEAGLPLTEKNQTLVRELLTNQMSINKQSIQNMLQQSYAFKNISISTLVLMNKHQIPLTEQNAQQLELYRNHNHHIIDQLTTLTEDLSILFEQLSLKGSSTPLESQLLSLALKGNATTASPNPLAGFASKEEVIQLIDILETFPFDEDLKSQLLNGSATLRDTIHGIQDAMNRAKAIDEHNKEEYFASQLEETDPESVVNSIGEELILPKTMDLFDHPVIHSLFDRFAILQYENNELSSFLEPHQRQILLDHLKGFPLGAHIRERILSGEATAKEVLTVIKNMLVLGDSPAREQLFQSQEFKTIFKEGLLHNWSLTPGTLSKESVEEFYPKLYEQLKNLENISQSILEKNTSSDLLKQTEHVKSNIDFMKTLNELFTHIQLPIHLREQTIHSELYVYTKKKELMENQNQVRVLLHLDMENLGPLDIHITLSGKQIVSKFYMEDGETGDLIAKHMDELEHALENKGFTFQSEILKRNGNVDIVKEFIENDMPVTGLKRYNFDIRA